MRLRSVSTTLSDTSGVPIMDRLTVGVKRHKSHTPRADKESASNAKDSKGKLWIAYEAGTKGSRALASRDNRHVAWRRGAWWTHATKPRMIPLYVTEMMRAVNSGEKLP